jgi:toxin-antitoxin system PIN domain toxin
MRALLDVNVLIALLDADHLHHSRARDWFVAEASAGWASCPITQNGCIRIMSHTSYPSPLPPRAVIERLVGAARHPHHQFWPDVVTLLEPTTADAGRIHGPRQVTDLYLLALAVRNDGRLATFDDAIPLGAIKGATPRHLAVIG